MKDALRIELKRTLREMKGINPKVSLYPKLLKRRDEILKKLEELEKTA